MSIKPILFSTPMVQAILAGRKTMTRRVIKPQPMPMLEFIGYENSDKESVAGWGIDPRVISRRKARIRPGDILWVRETFQRVLIEEDEPDDVYGYVYKASPGTFEDYGEMRDGEEYPLTWRPSIFMPREAARIFLRVTDVRVERLMGITDEDALAEGVVTGGSAMGHDYTAGEYFQVLWDRLNLKRGYGWDTNPWVWAYTFERCEAPE